VCMGPHQLGISKLLARLPGQLEKCQGGQVHSGVGPSGMGSLQ